MKPEKQNQKDTYEQIKKIRKDMEWVHQQYTDRMSKIWSELIKIERGLKENGV